MNKFILQMFRKLEEEGVKHCHFKSNNNLEPALNGVDDLDLLISQEHIDKFCSILSNLGFRQTVDRDSMPTPFVNHYFGVDPDTGLIVHLHVYFKMITGGSILKNHWIGVENMLLEESSPSGEGNVFIPSAEADLILFIIRKFIEQPSIVEHFLFLRDWENIYSELVWLTDRADQQQILELLARWLPEINPLFFISCLDLLKVKGSLFSRVKKR